MAGGCPLVVAQWSRARTAQARDPGYNSWLFTFALYHQIREMLHHYGASLE